MFSPIPFTLSFTHVHHAYIFFTIIIIYTIPLKGLKAQADSRMLSLELPSQDQVQSDSHWPLEELGYLGPSWVATQSLASPGVWLLKQKPGWTVGGTLKKGEMGARDKAKEVRDRTLGSLGSHSLNWHTDEHTRAQTPPPPRAPDPLIFHNNNAVICCCFFGRLHSVLIKIMVVFIVLHCKCFHSTF